MDRNQAELRETPPGSADYELDGFKSYYLLDGGPGVLVTVSIFDGADAALVSNEKATDWVRNNVLEFARGMPDVIVGNVLIAEVK